MTSRSTTRQGPASLRLRRNSRMRSVIGAIPHGCRSHQAPDAAVNGCKRLRAMGTRQRNTRRLPLNCLGLDGGIPVRTAGKDEQASSVTRAGGGDRQRPRKPDRRCFKPRPLLRAECAGFASGCRSDFLERLARLSRRLAGLLSGYLPTDTRPQARAKLGTTEITFFARCARELVRRVKNFLNFLFRRPTTRAHPRVVNGSMRCAARMNCTMTARPQSTNTTSSTRAPKLPRSNNVAMAHEPANAAPNTSAPIRMAALTTVVTLSQLMRRSWAMRSSFCEAQCRRNLLTDQVHRTSATPLPVGSAWTLIARVRVNAKSPHARVSTGARWQ